MQTDHNTPHPGFNQGTGSGSISTAMYKPPVFKNYKITTLKGEEFVFNAYMNQIIVTNAISFEIYNTDGTYSNHRVIFFHANLIKIEDWPFSTGTVIDASPGKVVSLEDRLKKVVDDKHYSPPYFGE